MTGMPIHLQGCVTFQGLPYFVILLRRLVPRTSPEAWIMAAAGSPGFGLFDETMIILKQALAAKESGLIIIHYAGHRLASED